MEQVKTSTMATDYKRWVVSLVYALQYIDANSFFLADGHGSIIGEMWRQAGGAWSVEGVEWEEGMGSTDSECGAHK